MADDRLRELARFESADLGIQVRLLRERMRAGDLADERVRLAAVLGNEAACQASTTQPGDLSDLRGHLEAVPKAEARAAFAALHRQRGGPLRRATRRVSAALRLSALGGGRLLDATEECFCAPREGSEERLRLARRAFRPTWTASIAGGVDPWDDLALAVSDLLDGRVPNWLDVVWTTAEDSYQDLSSRANLRSRARTLLAIRTELVPWALGLGDPVSERVAARGARE